MIWDPTTLMWTYEYTLSVSIRLLFVINRELRNNDFRLPKRTSLHVSYMFSFIALFKGPDPVHSVNGNGSCTQSLKKSSYSTSNRNATMYISGQILRKISKSYTAGRGIIPNRLLFLKFGVAQRNQALRILINPEIYTFWTREMSLCIFRPRMHSRCSENNSASLCLAVEQGH